MSIQIRSGKSLKNGSIEVKYSDGPKKTNTFAEEDAKPHEDLVNAMKALKIHAAIISESIDEAEYKTAKDKNSDGEKMEVPTFKNEETAENFRVSSFHITDKGIILSFTKDVKYGALNLNTPLINVAFESNAGYPFALDLKEKVNVAAKEFELYVMDNKRAPVPVEEVTNKIQMAIPLAELSDEEKAKNLAASN